jgi:hypothetical protein
MDSIHKGVDALHRFRKSYQILVRGHLVRMTCGFSEIIN